MTTNELLQQAWNNIAERMDDEPLGDAKREMAIAKTAIEDAQMRYTRGLAKSQGKFKPADLEK